MPQTILIRGSKFIQRQLRLASLTYAINVSPRPVVKVYGLLRTGTNYVTKLIELNFQAFTLRPTEEGWKHGPCQYSNKLKYVFLVKNPYSWIISFRNWEKIHKRTSVETLEDFILGPTTHVTLRDTWDLSNPLEAWNKSLRSWMNLKDRENVVFLRYEDFLESFNDQMIFLKNSLYLKQSLSCFQDLGGRADDWKPPDSREKLNLDYYRQNKFLEEFSENELILMRQHLDPLIMESFGYDVY